RGVELALRIAFRHAIDAFTDYAIAGDQDGKHAVVGEAEEANLFQAGVAPRPDGDQAHVLAGPGKIFRGPHPERGLVTGVAKAAFELLRPEIVSGQDRGAEMPHPPA